MIFLNEEEINFLFTKMLILKKKKKMMCVENQLKLLI